MFLPRSGSPTILPLAPNLMIHPLPPAPHSHLPLPRLWFTLCPSAKLSRHSLRELHHHPSIFSYHQTSIWAAAVAWLPQSAHLSSFYESAHISSSSNSLTAGFDYTFCGRCSVSWNARADIAQGGVSPQAPHYQCWWDKGWEEECDISHSDVIVMRML